MLILTDFPCKLGALTVWVIYPIAGMDRLSMCAEFCSKLKNSMKSYFKEENYFPFKCSMLTVPNHYTHPRFLSFSFSLSHTLIYYMSILLFLHGAQRGVYGPLPTYIFCDQVKSQ